MACETMSEPGCESYLDPYDQIVTPGCKTWNDGCNDCIVIDNLIDFQSILGCTKKYCIVIVEPRCTHLCSNNSDCEID